VNNVDDEHLRKSGFDAPFSPDELFSLDSESLLLLLSGGSGSGKSQFKLMLCKLELVSAAASAKSGGGGRIDPSNEFGPSSILREFTDPTSDSELDRKKME
jgi:hypothetical protein